MSTPRPFLVGAREPIDVRRLTEMQPKALQQLYLKLFGKEVPSGNTEHARRKIAWHVQADREGGVPESARQRALGIARDSKLRVRIGDNLDRRSQGLPLENTITTQIVSNYDSRLPLPGSNLIRKYKGRTIIVRVLSAGFEHDGRRYPSLTAIAKEITGTKWNGFLFFGLTGRRRSGQ